MVLGSSLTFKKVQLCDRAPPLVKLAEGGLPLVKLAKGGCNDHDNGPNAVMGPLVGLEEMDRLPHHKTM